MRLLAIADIAIRAVGVDAVDDEDKRYYSKFDFQPWPVDSFRMWLLMKDLLKALQFKQNLEDVG